MKKMFLVMGSTGEYSDRYEFNLRIVQTEERAKELVQAAQAEFDAIWSTLGSDTSYYQREAAFPDGWSKVFPIQEVPDYTGNHYWYSAVDFEE